MTFRQRCFPLHSLLSITNSQKCFFGSHSLKVGTDEANVSFYLSRWFTYISLIGSLSSSKAIAFLSANEEMSQLWARHY